MILVIYITLNIEGKKPYIPICFYRLFSHYKSLSGSGLFFNSPFIELCILTNWQTNILNVEGVPSTTCKHHVCTEVWKKRNI